jgi:hypothetical protein
MVRRVSGERDLGWGEGSGKVFKIFLSLDAWHTSSTFGLVKFRNKCRNENMNAKSALLV